MQQKQLWRLTAAPVAVALMVSGCGGAEQGSANSGSAAVSISRSAGDLCGALDSAARAYAPELGFEVSSTDHEAFDEEINCRWLDSSDFDFLKVEFGFDDFAYEDSRNSYEPYEFDGTALASGDDVLVLTDGGWTVAVRPLSNSGAAVDRASRDELLREAISVAERAGG